MRSVNSNNKVPLPYHYDGIKPGTKERHDDILTKKLVKINGAVTGVFTRVNNKTIWQKIQNRLFSSPVSVRDAAAFLAAKGLDKGAATQRINEIAYSSHEIPAKAFEEALKALEPKKNL